MAVTRLSKSNEVERLNANMKGLQSFAAISSKCLERLADEFKSFPGGGTYMEYKSRDLQL